MPAAEYDCVPLALANLCLDCDTISGHPQQFCAACGSYAVLPLRIALGDTPQAPAARVVPTAEARAEN